LYEQLSLGSSAALAYNVCFLVRRTLLIFVLILMDFNSCYQIQLFTLLSLANLLYLLSGRPIANSTLFHLEIFNECSTLLCSYLFLGLDAISQQGRRISYEDK